MDKNALHLEDLAPGQRYGSRKRIAVTADDITGFAALYDPQPFHLDEEAARGSAFGGLAASGWHTAAMTMRMLVESDFWPAGGIVGAGMDELRWPRPVRPGDDFAVLGIVTGVFRPMIDRDLFGGATPPAPAVIQ